MALARASALDQFDVRDVVQVEDGRIGVVKMVDDKIIGTPPTVMGGVLVEFERTKPAMQWFHPDKLTKIQDAP